MKGKKNREKVNFLTAAQNNDIRTNYIKEKSIIHNKIASLR